MKPGTQPSTFRWINGYWIPKKYRANSWMTADDPEGVADPGRPWEIELPLWIYKGILGRKDILAAHPDYFQLTGGLERWLYRLPARRCRTRRKSRPFTSAWTH